MTARTSVLIVEDEEDLRTALARTLETKGFQVQTTENGKKAIDFLQEREGKNGPGIDIILSDWAMPELDGMELLQLVRASNFARLPFVLMSGNVTREELSLAAKQGANAILVKPFDPSVLMERLRDLTSARPSAQKLNRLEVRVTNLTSGAKPKQPVSLLNIREKSLVLSIPQKFCTLKHHIDIQFLISEKKAEPFKMECTARVEKITPRTDRAERAELSLIQFVESEWKELIRWLRHPEEGSAFVFKAIHKRAA